MAWDYKVCLVCAGNLGIVEAQVSLVQQCGWVSKEGGFREKIGQR